MSTQAVELLATDLNPQGGIFCPSPKADMKRWNSHPKVYLDVAKTGQAKCPYCGTVYKLKAGEVVGHPHCTNGMVSTEVIVTTYNNPTPLHFALLGLDGQSTQAFTVCVADDGSGPETQAVVDHWRQQWGEARFRHIWHPDNGFAKNEILNKAIASSQADYLIFIDGDCVASPGYIQRHLDLRQPGQFVSGSLIRMPLQVNELLNDYLITTHAIFKLDWLKAQGCIKRIGSWLKTATLPLTLADFLERISPVKKVWNGCNSGGWRSDLLKVNGFDESMKYGAEDVEMGVRLNNAGIIGRHNRYTAPLLHIEHSRGYADPVVAAKNKRYMNSVRRSGKAWTSQGIVKADAPTPPTSG